jgi:uncharacterized repeat protein (TIGR01451 family)
MASTRLRRGSLTAALLMLAGIGAAQAASVTLKVVSARTESQALGGAGVVKGAPVADYRYLINIDNTGRTTQRSPNPGTGCSPQDSGYPGSCAWTSIAGTAGSSPVFTQGDQADFAVPMSIPDGRYLVSVLAEGYKLDGRHFTVAGNSVTWEGKAAGDPPGEVKVELQPMPLPDAQIQAAVFEDVSPVNSAPDLPAEHGLAGFQGHITDYLGEVTTNVYGDPLCSKYAANGDVIAGSGGRCLSACYVVNGGVDVGTVAPLDAAGRCPTTPTLPNGNPRPMLEGGNAPAGAAIEGKVKIPNLGPNRYALSVTPPDGTGWVQTTTLEGNHDWDAWVMEGSTGLDTEFIIAGEPFPAIIFGYVPVPGTPSAVGSALPSTLTGTATITGLVEAVKIYVPTTGGVPGLPGEIWGGLQGAKLDKPIEHPWVTLTDLDNGDTIVWAGQGDANGKFTIPNVPAGTYTLTWWDEPQNQILDLVNVTVANGESVDMGILPLSGWWTFFDGYVFNDTNRNGVKDAGEPGLAGYGLTMRKRENSLMDRGTTATTTDANGYYKFEAAYPMTQWLVMEAYDDLHYTTGITYQADNQPTPTTVLGAGVDVSVHPIIGLSGRMDWGKHTYDATGRTGIDPRNGGIVGTVSYDTTRNELDPRYAAVEDWQPSIPNLTVNLYAPINCGTTGATCDATGRYELDAATGAFARGPLLNNYLTETWQRPTGCIARGVDGEPLQHGIDEQVLPVQADGGCIEAPLLGVQFAAYETDQGTPDANFGAAVDGNYGFGDGCFVSTLPRVPGEFDPATGECLTGTLQSLPAGDYLVQVDLTSQLDAQGKPVYKVTREEDINIGNGDEFVPAVPPSECAGALHTVDVAGLGLDGPGATENPTFVDIGGSPYEGTQKPLCDVKLVNLSNGKSIAPAFNLYTDVPLPGRHWFIIIDDLNFSSNPRSTTYGEKAGMPFVPVGIYDYTDRLIKTVESDYNGLADVLLPSTNRINCPTPSGVCANLYRYVGNDPGVPGRLNTNYDPTFRTIAAEFEVLPGLLVPADLAPTQVGVTVQLPGGQTTSPVSCRLDDASPELYAVSRPFVTLGGNAAARTVVIQGKAFGASGQVLLDNEPLASGVTWGATQVSVTFPGNATPGPKLLTLVAANGQRTVNGLTLHLLGGAYNPQLYQVGPGLSGARTYVPAETLPAAANHAIQRALDDAANYVGAANNRNALVVVYPNNPSANPRQNPRGAYYENLIVTSRVKLQGVGPGSPDGAVRGSIIDGGAFAGDSPVATDWYTRIGQAAWDGNQTIYDGAVISLYLPAPTGGTVESRRRAFPTTYSALTAPSIDGFDLRGGDQAGFPGNINAIGGGPTGQPGGLITQGGAVFANAYARNLQITNNVVQNNGGAYGTIRIGTPDLPAPDTDNQNENVSISYNRVIANAGTNQAGGIGLFNGADGYQVTGNDICGNFSAEYGGGISVVGMSPGGTISGNRIYFNRSYDEGGGIMIAGALPATTTSLSPGSGAVDIHDNLIQANLANDDGGGLRFLMAGNFPMNVYNNFIVNNISTHEGGGVSINDAPNVRVFNNTIMKNLTTATAITSNGAAAPAGLSSSRNSDLLQATLPAGSPTFSNPLLFNNVFWDNRAGTRTTTGVAGLGAGDADHWDLGVADSGDLLSPTNSVLQDNRGINASATNVVGTDPGVAATYDVGVTFNTWRNNPAFLGAIMISADLPPNLMGNYHISAASPAYNAGAASKARPGNQGGGTQFAPGNDIDGDARPAFAAYDVGADEVRGATANLGIAKSDGVTSVSIGQQVTYTITVTNGGPDAVNGATVTDTMPARLGAVTWTCAPAQYCGAASGSGNIATTVSPLSGSAVTFTVTGTVLAGAGTTLVNTASVAAPAGTTDPSTANNTATDSDTIVVPVDLAVTVTDGKTLVSRGEQVRYTIVVTNVGPNAVTGATVNDNFPGVLSGAINWNCTTAGGATCGGGATGSGTINRTLNLPAGSSVTFVTTSGAVSTSTLATTLSNTAGVAVPGGYLDTNPADNSATDSDTINGVHVGALSGSGANSSATQWSASVTVTVHDVNHAPVAGAAVGGTWVGLGSGSGSCTTNAAGQCTVTRTGIPRTGVLGAGAIYTVTSLAHAPDGYQFSLNEASAVTVSRP